MAKNTYEVNANGNRSYSSRSAANVTSVAAAWAKQGHEPKAYAVLGGDESMVRIVVVVVSSASATLAALRAAK